MLRDIRPSFAIDSSNPVDDIFTYAALKNGYQCFIVDSWQTDLTYLPEDGLYWSFDYRSSVNGIYRHGHRNVISKVCITTSSGTISLRVAASSNAIAEEIVGNWRKIAKPSVATDDHSINIDFWTLSAQGPSSVRRKIEVPNWASIIDNYSAQTKQQLDKLFSPAFKPSHGGQLLLWHGEPGTGKTYAIRALGKEWQKWCQFEYIVDPDSFFGSAPSYMIKVLMGNEDHRWFDDDEEEVTPNMWRCLIFEDTGELLSENAANRSGQGLSRLLNVVDGLIGQGLKIMILITTNEELGSLHRAVSRPGRAAENIFFSELSAEESVTWATERDLILPTPVKKYTVAELYGLLQGHNLAGAKVPQDEHKVLGFRPTQKRA